MLFKHKLFQATPIYSLVITRITFGLLILWECYDLIASDIIFEAYVEPKFHFKYYGFEWVSNLPKEWIYWFFCLLAALAIFITLGLFYRISIILFTLGFTYAFFIEQSAYLNHYYMIILFGILLSFMPAHRYFSLDTYFNPRIRTEQISFWPIFLLRLQMEIILIFAGLAKINYDWLSRLMPLKPWLAQVDTIAPLHYLFTQNWSLTIAAYGTVILHLAGAPLLLFKRSRIYVFILYCVFHILNDHAFQIGSFPWMSIAITAIFFDADWPKKIFKFFNKTGESNLFEEVSRLKQKVIIFLMIIWTVTQIILPLRYLLYPGNVSWTGEGQRFAWRMKLNTTSGVTFFYVTDLESNQQKRVDVRDYLTFAQYSELQCQPDLILQFTHHIRKVWTEEKGYKDVKVTAKSYCSLNKRKSTLFLDPDIDLSRAPRNLKHKDWIIPFDPKSQ